MASSTETATALLIWCKLATQINGDAKCAKTNKEPTCRRVKTQRRIETRRVIRRHSRLSSIVYWQSTTNRGLLAGRHWQTVFDDSDITRMMTVKRTALSDRSGDVSRRQDVAAPGRRNRTDSTPSRFDLMQLNAPAEHASTGPARRSSSHACPACRRVRAFTAAEAVFCTLLVRRPSQPLQQ